MIAFLESSNGRRAVRDFDRITSFIATSVSNHWSAAYPAMPITTNGPEIFDEAGQSYDPPRYSQVITMEPDLAASQVFWDEVGPAGLPLCIGHAIMGNGANYKHLLAGGGELPPEVAAAGMALFGAAIAFRDACEAAGLTESLPVKVLPPVTLTPDQNGHITVSPLVA